MPWTAAGADKHKKGLTPAQQSRWAAIANSVLAECRKTGGGDCEGRAIRIANARCGAAAKRVGRLQRARAKHIRRRLG